MQGSVIDNSFAEECLINEEVDEVIRRRGSSQIALIAVALWTTSIHLLGEPFGDLAALELFKWDGASSWRSSS
jgi:hypothetical protein